MPRANVAAALLSVAGVAISIYLTALHFAGVVPACPVSGVFNCDAVLGSKYAVLAGTSIPTSALGIVWFAVSAALWTLGWKRSIYGWSGAGLAFVTFLVFIEVVLVGAVCLWCTAAHVLVLALFLIALNTWQRERVV